MGIFVYLAADGKDLAGGHPVTGRTSSPLAGNERIGLLNRDHVNRRRTSVPGNIWVTPSRFYVRFDRDDVDTVRVLFKFTSGAAVGGDGIEVSVREMYYNDRLIIKNSDYSREEGIVIMKR